MVLNLWLVNIWAVIGPFVFIHTLNIIIMNIFTVHTENNKAYVIVPNGDKIYVPMDDENVIHIHKNFNGNSNIHDIEHDVALYLQLSIDNKIVKSIINIIKSHK